jgi:hypothetical protein
MHCCCCRCFADLHDAPAWHGPLSFAPHWAQRSINAQPTQSQGSRQQRQPCSSSWRRCVSDWG